jgi:PAS domain S-box-containing protein
VAGTDRTKDQLLKELNALRRRVAELEGLKTEHKRVGDALRESEEMYKTLVQTSPDAVTVTDLKGKITEVSQRTVELHGFRSVEELKGKSAFELIAPEDHKRARANLRKTLKEGLVRNVEYVMLKKDGTCFVGEMSASLVKDVRGKPKAFVGIARDITERKQADEALRESEAKYRELFATESDGIMILDVGSNQFTDVNNAALRLYGYTRDEFSKIKPTDLSAEPEKSRAAIDSAIAGKIDMVPLRYHKKKDGTVFPVEISFKVFVLKNRKMICALMRDITERERKEQALRESEEEKFRNLAEQSPNMIFINQKGRVVYANKKCEEITGYRKDEFFSPDFDFLRLIAPESVELIKSNLARHQKGEEVETDITENKRLEAQLLWSQKMETVGRLAGGVAHDFNNMLTTIRGCAEMGMVRLGDTDPLHNDLHEIIRAADRAASLTRRLLAFSRRQITEPKLIDLNHVLLDMDQMLRRLIGEDIELVTLPGEDLGSAEIDPGQIQQVIVNLSVNARDAMPEGGKLTIETGNVTFDREYARRHVGATPGDYVMLAVADTGVGMTKEVQAHLFEPFFTTKETGKGTGLGLATCYGIVKQVGGNIWVDSKPNVGTTFKIYLPQVEGEAEALPQRQAEESGELPRGTETVLLVEDESSVRRVTARTLRELGYSVLEAENGVDALRIAREHGKKLIHLMLTDIVMPQMGGKELADRVKTKRPGIRVLFFSGYTDEAVADSKGLFSGMNFLQKPFSSATLAHKVRDILDR